MVSQRPQHAASGSAVGVHEGERRWLPSVRVARIGLLLAWPPVLGLGLLATVDAFGLGDDFAIAAWTSGLWLIGLTLVLGLRDMRAADARTAAALTRAETAEAAQHARADELAAVLRASEGLTLMGEGRLDFTGILAALTPAGATSYLARLQSDSEFTVVAAHGPLAPWVIGARRPLDSTEGSLPSPQVTSYSASGRVVGVSAVPAELGRCDTAVQAALGVRLADHGGRPLGHLYLLDPAGERILEPEFVGLTQLVADQIGVALENQALLARVQHQLSEVQRVQHQLALASKLGAIGELAAAVAHEVNNPLTGILGFSELLLDELPEGDSRHDEAAVIHSEAVRARSIIRALLEFARPRPPQRIPSDLNGLASTTLELVRFRAHQAGIVIVEEYNDVPCLEIDPDAFKQVMLNLLNNALDAMPSGGQLRISTRATDERVGVIVADSGIGMDPDTRARVFTPFFSTRSDSESGTGLGLSVSLQIVEGHGGTIEVDSEPGLGSTFTVWLPAAWSTFEGAVIVPGTDLVAGDLGRAGSSTACADAPAGSARSRGEAA